MISMQKPDYNFDESFAFLEILRILSNTDKFHNWLKEYHHLQSIDDILEGYKYIIATSLRCFIQSLMLNDPFKLKDDRFLIRGDFRIGKSLDDVPNRCEKTIFMKNVWNCGKDIRKAKSWEEIGNAKSLSILLNVFENLFRDNIRSNSKISKEDAVRFAAQFWAYLELVDCRFGMPKGSRASLFEIEKSTVYLDKVFAGYLYSLQFLWFELLGDEKFKKTVLKDLHSATETKFERPDNSITISFDESDYETVEIPESKEEKQKRLEYERVFKKWESIDQFFEEIKYEIIRPLEKDLELRADTIPQKRPSQYEDKIESRW